LLDSNHSDTSHDQVSVRMRTYVYKRSCLMHRGIRMCAAGFEKCITCRDEIHTNEQEDLEAIMKPRQAHALQNTCITCSLKGNVTITHFEEIKNELVEALLSSDLLLLDVEEVDAIDMDGIMLLCAINRSAAIRGKRVELVGAIKNNFVSQVASAGFPRKECMYKASHACLWNVAGYCGAADSATSPRDIRRRYVRTLRYPRKD